MTTTPLPPLPESNHVINTFDGSGILGMGQVDGYTSDQMKAYATQARADLEAENARLREVLQVLVDNGGIGPEWMFDDARTALKDTK